MVRTRRRATALATAGLGAAILSLAVLAAGPSSASPLSGPKGLTSHLKPNVNRALLAPDDGGGDDDGGETEEIMDRSEQYASIRTAPAATVSSQAFTAARSAAAALPSGRRQLE